MINETQTLTFCYIIPCHGFICWWLCFYSGSAETGWTVWSQVSVAVTMIGKFAITTSFTFGTLYTREFFPTNLRYVRWFMAFVATKNLQHMYNLDWYSSFINSCPPCAAYMRQWIGSALVQTIACRLFGIKPLFQPMLSNYQLDP